MNVRTLIATLILAACVLVACGDADDDGGDGGAASSRAVPTDTTATDSPDRDSAQPAGGAGAGVSNGGGTAVAPGDVNTRLLHGDRVARGTDLEEGSDEDAIAEVVDVLYDAFADGKPKRFCDQVSQEAREQMAKEVGGNTGPDVVCLQTFDPLVLRAGKKNKLNATLRARVTAVQVDGDRATVTMDFAGKPGTLPFVREGDRWKLAAASR